MTADVAVVTLIKSGRLIDAVSYGQMEPGKRNRFLLPGSICACRSEIDQAQIICLN